MSDGFKHPVHIPKIPLRDRKSKDQPEQKEDEHDDQFLVKNKILDEILKFIAGVGILVLPPRILAVAIPSLDKDPLIFVSVWIFLSSLGFTIFMYKGGFLVRSFKWLATCIVLSILWIPWVGLEKARNAMVKSCAAGNLVACSVLDTENAEELVSTPEESEVTACNENDKSFDCEYKRVMKDSCLKGGWVACDNINMERSPKAQQRYKQFLADEAFIEKHRGFELSPEDQRELERIDREYQRNKKLHESIRRKYGG